MRDSPTRQLTEHFKLSEFFIHQDQFDQQSWDYLNRQSLQYQQAVFTSIERLSDKLEKVRSRFNQPLHIHSGYRCPAINKIVGGYPNSYHMKGMAADIVIEQFNPQQVQEKLQLWLGGMGSYSGFTHLDIRPYKARWTGI